MAKRRKLSPNRFQEEAEQRFFSLDPTRRNLLKWGAVAGGLGSLFILQQSLVWQIIGFLIIFFISNYQVDRAARLIPRWHAVLYSLAGAMAAMIIVITLGGLILANLTGAPLQPVN